MPSELAVRDTVVRSGDATDGGIRPVISTTVVDMPFAIGAATAIGSLPHSSVDEAVHFALESTPDIPAAPSVPSADARESMIAQVAWGVQGVDVAIDGTLTVDASRVDPEAVGDIDGPGFGGFRAFVEAVVGRTGPVKIQMTGPVTFALVLVDAGLAPDVASRLALNVVRSKASAMVDLLALSAPEAQVVAWLDEPGLASARLEMLSDQESIIDLVSSALAVWENRAITGVHCCGETDWKALLNAGGQILSTPVGAGLGPAADSIARFLERGGWVAWGAVPTDRPLGESASHWWRELSAQWCELVRAGCDPVLIRQQALVTPACGLALHDLSQIERVFDLTRDVGARIGEQLAGVRLSVGA